MKKKKVQIESDEVEYDPKVDIHTWDCVFDPIKEDHDDWFKEWLRDNPDD